MEEVEEVAVVAAEPVVVVAERVVVVAELAVWGDDALAPSAFPCLRHPPSRRAQRRFLHRRMTQ